jgi:hypothetical protein
LEGSAAYREQQGQAGVVLVLVDGLHDRRGVRDFDRGVLDEVGDDLCGAGVDGAVGLERRERAFGVLCQGVLRDYNSLISFCTHQFEEGRREVLALEEIDDLLCDVRVGIS